MSLYTSGYTGVEIDEGIRRTYEVFSNRNLLHNWDFRNPVNQRGVTVQTSDDPNLDRWITYSAGVNDFSLSTITGGIRIGVTSGWVWQLQRLESLPNGAYTMSVKLTNGTIHSKTVLWDGSEVGGAVAAGLELRIFTSGTPRFRVQILAGHSYDIESVKLELGSVSTLANDPPADFGEQLALCQRYLIKLPQYIVIFGLPSSPDTVDLHLYLPVSMRITPSVVGSGLSTIGGVSGFTLGTAVSPVNSPFCRLRATKTAHGLTGFQFAEVTDNATYLSADL